MLIDNDTIQVAVSSATLLGIVGYIVHSIWSGYCKFRENIYKTLKEKQDIGQCNEYRRIEERHEDYHNKEDK